MNGDKVLEHLTEICLDSDGGLYQLAGCHKPDYCSVNFPCCENFEGYAFLISYLFGYIVI
jgi:hypothetical protein